NPKAGVSVSRDGESVTVTPTGTSGLDSSSEIMLAGGEAIPAGLKLRKSHRSMTQDDWKKFRDAITRLKTTDAPEGGIKIYQKFVGTHAAVTSPAGMMWGAHTMSPSDGRNFLAWHREFLLKFEEALGMPIP